MEYTEALSLFERGEYSRAFPSLLALAEDGHAAAQCIVGNYFDLGLDGRVDREEARRWYTLSADQGYGVALNNLGTLARLEGKEALARTHYEEARRRGSPHSPCP